MAVLPQRTRNGGLLKNDNGVLRVGCRMPSPDAPSGPVAGDLWYETDNSVLWAYDGVVWDPVGGVLAFNAAVPTGTGTTSSTSFVDVPGPVDLAFSKRATHTSLLMWGTMTHYITANTGLTAHAVRINGVDYSVGDFFFNQVSVHTTIGMSNKIATGLAAGNYTARLRWRCVSAGMTLNVDANDVANFNIMEVIN